MKGNPTVMFIASKANNVLEGVVLDHDTFQQLNHN